MIGSSFGGILVVVAIIAIIVALVLFQAYIPGLILILLAGLFLMFAPEKYGWVIALIFAIVGVVLLLSAGGNAVGLALTGGVPL